MAEPEVGAISVPSVRTVVVFPAPLRPEETEDLAVADLERDVLERDPVTETLAQTRRGQRRLAVTAVEQTHVAHPTVPALRSTRSRLLCHRRAASVVS